MKANDKACASGNFDKKDIDKAILASQFRDRMAKTVDFFEKERQTLAKASEIPSFEAYCAFVSNNALLKNDKKYKIDDNNYKVAKDAYTNPFAQYGYGTTEVSNAGEFLPTRNLTWNFIRINNIYRSQPLVAKISKTWAYEQVKSGIDFQLHEKDPSINQFIENEIQKYSRELADEANWGYVYGLSAGVILIDGECNEESMREPLDIKKITKDSFLGLKTVVRWQGIIPDGIRNVDFDDLKDGVCSADDLGEPLYYNVTFNNDSTYKVHRSRLLIFRGERLAGIEEKIERGCGVSLVERLYLPLMNYQATINYVLKMLQNSQERVLYTTTGDRVALMSEEGQAQYEAKMQSIAHNQNTQSLVVLDEDDEMAFLGANFSNLDKIIQCAQEDFAASGYMPLNKLFGKSPTGMNSSSKENLTDFYDFVERERSGDMQKNINTLIKIIYKSKYGKEIGDYSFKFKSLWIPTEDEKALIIDRKMRPVEKAWESNAITLSEYLTEASNIGKISDSFMSLTENTFKELKANGLENARYSDMATFVINGKFIDNEKVLKRLYKEKILFNNGNRSNGNNGDVENVQK